ncbi:MAG TPA: hypothetical protein VGD83_05695 [Streptosporangiaceae bacterium]
MAPSNRLDRDTLSRILIEQLDVITRSQALAAGMTGHALRHRLRPGGPWRGLLPGVYMAATGAPTTLQQEMAALLYAGPGSVITGPAALRSHHIRTELTDTVDVLVPSTRQRRDTGFVRLHRTTRMPERIWEAGPVQYVMPARAVADAVRAMTSLRDVRALVADAVQHDKCTIKTLATELSQGPNKASVLFREALADVADGIRSAAEGDLRDLLARSGLPMPLFNPSLYDEHGNFVARPDAWWPELGIAVEVDSKQWHTSPEDHAKTLARGRRMARYQIVVLRFTPRQIRSQPAEVRNDIKAALDGARGRPLTKLKTIPAGEAHQGAAA